MRLAKSREQKKMYCGEAGGERGLLPVPRDSQPGNQKRKKVENAAKHTPTFQKASKRGVISDELIEEETFPECLSA